MVRQLTTILLLSYFAFGTLCLPQGDFSAIADLPEMYRHCKATEHPDMTPLDFITDHLINIDGIFDKHENGDEQKPHQSNPKQHHGQTIISFVTYFTMTLVQFHGVTAKLPNFSDHFLPSDYITKIFRPPIV